MAAIVQRVCWNTRGWQLPAGSTDEKGFPGEKGFGHEEWNFQLDDAVLGWVYGYIYTSPALQHQQSFPLYFYSIHPTTRERLLVGCYENAELVAEDEYKKVLESFRARGILDRRARELRSAVSNMSRDAARKEIESSLKESWLKVKCPADSITIFDPPIKISTRVGDKTLSHRFKMFTYVELAELKAALPRATKGDKRPVRVDLAEDGYFRESRENLREIVPRHNALSNALCRWLEKRGIVPRQENRDVDVEFEYRGSSHRVEIKVSYGASIRHALREAIGQLIEYNIYPGRERSDKWIVLLDRKPGPEQVEYVNSLRKEFNLPLHLAWHNKKEFEFFEPKPFDL
ncbi:hypothetical protein [Panacagrimonas sp.]|uniref:hypothetical protein n=1 Tax=Panacagrimonas sp. TaxID=2480088 RepID=UPI003B5214B4